MVKKINRLLRTDTEYILKGGTWSTATLFLTVATSLLVSVVFANYLDPNTYGNYKYVLSFIGTITAFSLSGINLLIIKSVSKGHEGSFISGAKQALKWNSLIFTFGVICSIYYLLSGNIILGSSLFVASIAQPLLLSSKTYSSFLNGRKNFRAIFVFRIIETIISTAAVIFVAIHTENPLTLITTYYLSHTIINAAFFFIVRKVFKPNQESSEEDFKETVHFSLMTVLADIAGHIDKILVFKYLGVTQLAIYGFALAPYTQLRSPSKIVINLVLPKFSARNFDEIRKGIHHKVFILFIVYLSIFIAYYLSTPYIYSVLFPKYMESVLYTQILALGLLSAPAILYNKALVAHAKIKELYIIKTVSPVIKIILLFVLIQKFDLMGLVIAVTVSEYISSILSVIIFTTSNKTDEIIKNSNV